MPRRCKYAGRKKEPNVKTRQKVAAFPNDTIAGGPGTIAGGPGKIAGIKSPGCNNRDGIAGKETAGDGIAKYGIAGI